MNKNLKAIFFDMNGVVINDELIHEQAFREVLKQFNIFLSHEEYEQSFLGRSDMTGFKRFNQTHKLPVELNELAEKKMEKYWSLVDTGIPEVPGAINTIKQLSEKYTLGLTTGASKLEKEVVFKQFDIARYFTASISVEDFKKSKPDPEPYSITADMLGIEPKNCLVIEDAPAGIRSAKRAGMQCIAITTSYESSVLHEADYVVDSFEEIKKQLLS